MLIDEMELIVDEPCVDVCETRVVSELDEDVDVIVDGIGN